MGLDLSASRLRRVQRHSMRLASDRVYENFVPGFPGR
jgi:hypothetical protein